MEGFKVSELFACADKFYRLARYGSYRKGGAASCITVKLSKNNAVYTERFIKAFGNINGILTRHGINNKQYLVRMHGGFYILKFLHKGFINMKTACRVKKDIIVAVILCIA